MNLGGSPHTLADRRDTGKWLLPALFILAVLVKSLLLRTYLYIDGDRSLQVLAAAEWARGFGYTIPETDLSQINLVQHRPLLEWPPLYSALLVPLIRWTNNFTTPCFILDTLGAFLYLWAIWKITIRLRFLPWMQMVVVWFKATEIYEGFLSSFPTDFLAAGCLLWAIYFFMVYIGESSRKWIGMMALCLGAAFLFRYVYLTALPVLPLLLWFYGFRQNKPAWRRDAILLGMLVGIVVVGYLGYNKLVSGSYTYLENWDKGFYPEKLGNMVPLLWQSIAQVSFIGVQLELLFKQPYGVFFNGMLGSSVLVLAIMLFAWIRRSRLAAGSFGLPAFLFSAAIVFTLALLSIRIDFPRDSQGGTWSYLVEDRYFLVPMAVITIAIVAFIGGYSWRRTGWQWALKCVLLCFFVVQVAHTGWILKKRIPLLQTEDPDALVDSAGKRASLLRMFSEGRQKGHDVVLLTKEYGYLYCAWRDGVKLCRQVNRFGEQPAIGVSRATTIVLALKEMEYRKYKESLDKYHFEVRARFPEEVQLITTLQPNNP